MFTVEAQRLAQHGYYPTSQSWAQGQWGLGAFLAALLLAVVLIGILIFIYLIIVKPDGTLTVTYELRDARLAGPPTAPPETVLDATLAARLEQLDGAHRAGLISDQEYADKRQEVLSGF